MKSVLLTGLLLAVGALFGGTHHWMGAESTSVTQEQDTETQEQMRAEARQLFMRGKLASNQLIVEGLATSDYEKIAEGAVAVKALVKGQHWFVIDTPEYKRFSEDMEMAARRLQEAANAKNMDAAALRYFDLTLDCLDCHRYIETRKY